MVTGGVRRVLRYHGAGYGTRNVCCTIRFLVGVAILTRRRPRRGRFNALLKGYHARGNSSGAVQREYELVSVRAGRTGQRQRAGQRQRQWGAVRGSLSWLPHELEQAFILTMGMRRRGRRQRRYHAGRRGYHWVRSVSFLLIGL